MTFAIDRRKTGSACDVCGLRPAEFVTFVHDPDGVYVCRECRDGFECARCERPMDSSGRCACPDGESELPPFETIDPA